MSKDRLRKDELLEWLGEENDYHPYNNLFDDEFNLQAWRQIRQMIENWPEVDEVFVEKWRAEFVSGFEAPEDNIIQMLTEAGVKIVGEKG